MAEEPEFEVRRRDPRRYQEELPDDNAKVRRLLETYSQIPPDQVVPRLRAIREKAWRIFPYPCIGRWRFLDLYVTTLPEYPAVLRRLQAGETLLDAGCCMGYVLRQLVLDGAPASQLVGADLRREYIDLGYELFGDRDTFGGRFVTGDMLAEPGDPDLAPLDGAVDMIHAASFFHLFGWADQVKLGRRVVRFFKPGQRDALLFGRQVGERAPLPPGEHEARGLGEYRHDPATLQALWDEIGRATGTRWQATATLEDEDAGPEEGTRTILKFAVRKVE